MLYDDEEGDCVTESEDLWDLLAKDVSEVDMVLWVGISFEQSASVEYFRKVRTALLEQDRTGTWGMLGLTCMFSSEKDPLMYVLRCFV